MLKSWCLCPRLYQRGVEEIKDSLQINPVDGLQGHANELPSCNGIRWGEA